MINYKCDREMGDTMKKIILPDIPENEKCDYRLDYDSGMSISKIAEKYYCDKRTVRTALIYNHSSNQLGKRKKPTQLSKYEHRIEVLWHEYKKLGSLYTISKTITQTINNEGYTGKERTVRNYLLTMPYVQAYKGGTKK